MAKLLIKRIEADLPLPEFKTTGAAAFDLYSRIDTVIPPQTLLNIPLNVIIKIPDGHFCILAARSSSPVKKGITAGNGIGVIDSDFCGPGDEWHFSAYNFTDQPVTIERGERIAQVILIKLEPAELIEIEEVSAPTRGAFGSTG